MNKTEVFSVRQEKSCGALIYRLEGGEPLFLVERMRLGHVSLCKGHVEGDETEHETASREIMEETALSVRFVDGFRRTISYSPRQGVMKEVVFFLAEAEQEQTTPQECEVSSIAWLRADDALAAMTYAEDRSVLEAAIAFLANA